MTASFPLAFNAVKASLGGSSLSVIVTVCAGAVLPIVTLSALPVNVTTNFSLFSSKASSTITALIVWEVLPAVILKESLARV